MQHRVTGRSLALLGAALVLVVAAPARAQDDETPLIVGTLRHDGLLQPWAIWEDSAFRSIDDSAWTIADSVSLWHVATDTGWFEVSTYDTLSEVDDRCMEFGTGYKTSLAPYNDWLSCPPWRHGTAFTVRPKLHKFSSDSTRGERFSDLVRSAFADSIEARVGTSKHPELAEEEDRNLRRLAHAVRNNRPGAIPVAPLSAELEGIRVMQVGSSIWISDELASEASADWWFVQGRKETLLTEGVHVGPPKLSPPGPNPTVLVLISGRLFAIGEVGYWEGSDPAIWEIANGRVDLVLVAAIPVR